MNILRAKLVGGGEIEFLDEQIGAGGEKAVFFARNKQEVVCFFFKGLPDRNERRRRLDNILGKHNVTTGQHGAYWKTHFCWPTGIIDGDPALPKAFLAQHHLMDPPLAVVGPAYRQNFYFRDTLGKTREKNGKWFTAEKPRRMLPSEEKGTFLNYLQVCTKMARATRRMHFSGLAHSDLSNKNVLIDPRGGDACLIDIDSLVVPGIAPPSVMGTPGYIAPEVLANKGQPRIETDRHALAVLIYESLLLRHPLRGPKVNSRTSPEEDELLSMGAKALFIEHPQDISNSVRPPPVVPSHRLGPYLAELFRKAFVDGLHEPNRRPAADDWERGLYRTFDILHPSPGNSDWFVLAPGMPLQCPFTRKRLTAPVPYAHFHSERQPGHFVSDGHGLTIYHHLPLMIWHTTRTIPGENADRTRKGYFSYHQERWWLTNESDDVIQPTGGAPVGKGESVELKEGMELRASSQPNARLFRIDFLK